MPYFFYLNKVPLPVAPSKLQLKIKNQNKSVTLINEGEVNVLKAAGLTEITFDCIIPQTKYPFARYADGFKPASYYLANFEALKNSKKSFQFICSRFTPSGVLLFDTNMAVSMEDYKIEDNAEDGLDLTVSISLKQFVSYGTKTIVLPVVVVAAVVPPPVAARPADTAPAPRTYTVVKGDCLWAIAKRFLGKGSRESEIFALNRDKIKNKNLIFPGQVFTLPNA